jgi:hypothetical protein
VASHVPWRANSQVGIARIQLLTSCSRQVIRVRVAVNACRAASFYGWSSSSGQRTQSHREEPICRAQSDNSAVRKIVLVTIHLYASSKVWIEIRVRWRIHRVCQGPQTVICFRQGWRHASKFGIFSSTILVGRTVTKSQSRLVKKIAENSRN